MYVAVKGGEKAIDAAHALQESRRRGNTDLPELSVAQIEQQLNLAVDRVMTEGGIADRELAALALKQASGDNVEAIFLLRAYRTTLAKLAVSEPLDTTGMRLERRISAVYKDIPGGQLLGPTYDYTHRLLDFTLLANGEAPTLTTADSEQQPSPHVFSLLARQGLAKFEEDSGAQPDDITRTPPVYPCSRSSRLQRINARRRRLFAGAGLLHPAWLRTQSSVRRRNPQRLYRRVDCAGRAGICGERRRTADDRM